VIATASTNSTGTITVPSVSAENAQTTSSTAIVAPINNLVTTSNGHLGFTFPPPVTDTSISQANLAATTAALLQQQQSSIANMISSHQQNTLNALNAQPSNQSMPNLHAGFPSAHNASAPASNGLLGARASPALNNLSPRSTSHLIELHKNNLNDPHRTGSADPWDTANAGDVKPLLNKVNPTIRLIQSKHCL
jgi:hypothetical protein